MPCLEKSWLVRPAACGIESWLHRTVLILER